MFYSKKTISVTSMAIIMLFANISINTTPSTNLISFTMSKSAIAGKTKKQERKTKRITRRLNKLLNKVSKQIEKGRAAGVTDQQMIDAWEKESNPNDGRQGERGPNSENNPNGDYY